MSMEYKLPYTAKEIEDKLEQIDSKLNASELTSAINVALNTAKNSGEFDGQDGEDGIGIDSATINGNGELVITYSNGNVVNLGRVVGRDSADEVVVPDYWKEYLDSKIETIKSNQDKAGKDAVSYIVITDMHYPSNKGLSPILAKYIMDKCDIKFVLILGDTRTRGVRLTKEDAEAEWDDIDNLLKPLHGNILMTQGNHDAGFGKGDYDGDGDLDNYAYEFTPAEMFNRVYRRAGIAGDVHYDNSGTAYYIDDTSNKIRYILLNTHLNFNGNKGYSSYETVPDGKGGEMAKYPSEHNIFFRYTQCQYDFLIKTLNSIPDDDWKVIIGSHVPINQTDEMPEFPVMIGVLEAYNNRGKCSLEYEGTSSPSSDANFTNLFDKTSSEVEQGRWRYDDSGKNVIIEEVSTNTALITNKIDTTFNKDNPDILRISYPNMENLINITLRVFNSSGVALGTLLYNCRNSDFANDFIFENNIMTWTVGKFGNYMSTTAHGTLDYVQFCFESDGKINADDIIITVNEDISYTDTLKGYDYVSVNCDFSSAKGKLMAYHGGHKHIDEYSFNCYRGNSISFPIIITRCDGVEENLEDLKGERLDEHGQIKEGTTEQSFDVFTVTSKAIYATKIGAGSDRTITYQVKKVE